jgi:hypothetical protein
MNIIEKLSFKIKLKTISLIKFISELIDYLEALAGFGL